MLLTQRSMAWAGVEVAMIDVAAIEMDKAQLCQRRNTSSPWGDGRIADRQSCAGLKYAWIIAA
ncbi:hypothetical protein GCM10012289_41950 [Nonomuraea cavernae]|uniref:Uncharacterized protein n=1 Tax=Nonomuraea cavernae TaxID=2045107 RepID=A0A918DLQ2_9ACTN|nr:hypothetical protein GCM10012289_41950 [Nonomuraea cavernae]